MRITKDITTTQRKCISAYSKNHLYYTIYNEKNYECNKMSCKKTHYKKKERY
jgi:hypothetical protein